MLFKLIDKYASKREGNTTIVHLYVFFFITGVPFVSNTVLLLFFLDDGVVS